MLDFNRIINDVCRATRPVTGINKTAARNHYEWSLPNGMRTGDRVRLKDGREGSLTSPFPGCRGDGDWCGIFLDDGSEENIRPDHVAAFPNKSAERSAVTGGETVRYVVEFQNLGTSNMSARMVRNDEDGETETVGSRDHKRSSELLQALVAFEGAGQDESPPTGGIHGDTEPAQVETIL